MKKEPGSVRDMAWADRQRSNAVNVEFEKVTNEPSEGKLSDVAVRVIPDEQKNVVRINRERSYFDHRSVNNLWSMRVEREPIAELSFEEFRNSEWWEPYIEKTKYQNFDSSWMDSFDVDADEDHAEINFECPEFKKVWWCSSEVPSGRIAKCRVYVGSDGILYLKVEKEDEEANIIEFIEAVRRLREFEKAGVSLDDEGNVIVRKTAERGE